MIEQLIGSGILVALGAGGMWLWMRGRAALLERDISECIEDYCRVANASYDLSAAHSRLSDAHNSTKERIERALECETANAAHGVRKMAAILRGER